MCPFIVCLFVRYRLHNLNLFVTYDRDSGVFYYKYIKTSASASLLFLPFVLSSFPLFPFFLLLSNQTMPVRQIYRFVRNQYEKRFNSSKKESSANAEAPADEIAPGEAEAVEQPPVEGEVVAEAAPEAEAQATK